MSVPVIQIPEENVQHGCFRQKIYEEKCSVQSLEVVHSEKAPKMGPEALF